MVSKYAEKRRGDAGIIGVAAATFSHGNYRETEQKEKEKRKRILP